MSASAGAIRAGRAFVEMFADPSKLYRVLEASKRRFLAWGKEIGKLGLGAAGIGAAVATPITKMFTGAVEEGADIGKLARQLGSTAEQVSVLRGAFAQAGVGADEFAAGMASLGQKISHAADSGGPLLDNLQSLGNARDFLGKGLDAQLDLIAERIKAIPDAAGQARAAGDLGLGAMVDVLRKGKAGLDEYRAAAIANGDAMSSEQVAQATEIQREYNRTMLAGKSTLLEVGKSLLPTGASFASVGASIRSALGTVRDWISANKQTIAIVSAIAGGLVAGGLAVAGFGAAVALVAPIIGGLVIAIKAAVVVVGAVLSPIGLVVIALAAAAAGMAYLASRTEAGIAAFKDLKAWASDAAGFIKSSWKGITDAIGAGDFKLAFDIALKSAEVVWREFVLKLTTLWVGFKATFVDAWEEATGFVAKAMVSLGASIEKNLLGTLRKMIDGFNSFADKLPGGGRLKIHLPGVRSDAEIDQEAKDIKQGIDDITAAEKKRRDDFRKGQLKDAMDARDLAKEQLDLLKKQAEEARKKAEWDAIPWAEDDEEEAPAAKSPPSLAALAEAAKGTFSSFATQQSLGYGDQLGQRQLDAMNNLAATNASQLTVLEQIRDKPGGIVLK